jgi:hypothetical protein
MLYVQENSVEIADPPRRGFVIGVEVIDHRANHVPWITNNQDRPFGVAWVDMPVLALLDERGMRLNEHGAILRGVVLLELLPGTVHLVLRHALRGLTNYSLKQLSVLIAKKQPADLIKRHRCELRVQQIGEKEPNPGIP